MTPEDLKITLRWGTIAAAAGGLILIANAIGAANKFEPYFPATRGYAREVVEIAQLSKADQEKQIAQGLKETSIGILDLKITALAGQYQALETQLKMLDARVTENPTDGLLRDLRNKVGADLRDVLSKGNLASCEKSRLQGIGQCHSFPP